MDICLEKVLNFLTRLLVLFDVHSPTHTVHLLSSVHPSPDTEHPSEKLMSKLPDLTNAHR